MEEINISIETQRHSLSHILAEAVQRIKWPQIQLWIWPAIENGFYYDFDTKIVEEDLKGIQNMMEKIIKENQEIIRFDTNPDNAKKILKDLLHQSYKLELLQDFVGQWETKISFYLNTIDIKAKDILLKDANAEYVAKYEEITKYFKEILPEWKFVVFVDMCEWPHVSNTKEIKADAFKIDRTAGAYWKWDEKNVMMSRIYGYAFAAKDELKQHLAFLEEAKKRDHKKLGKELGLYTIDPDVWLWLVLWKPKGAFIVNTLKRWFEDEQLKRWYVPVITPHIWRKTLWETSGHWGFYNDSIYPPLELGQTLADYQDKRTPKESEIYLMKPMNCPFHIKIYNDDVHSYRDLPIKMYEFGTVYRYEKKWELGGLTRVRWFTQDDAHIICRHDQLEDEFAKVVDFVYFVLGTFGYEIKVYMSMRDPANKSKYLWSDEMWEKAQSTIKNILTQKWIDYVEEEWEAAFYWPKADFKVKDSIWRYFQLSTVQFDFNLPEKFDVYFVNEKWEKEKPFIIHRALLGSLERFMWILIEHLAGSFPLWLAPVQVKILPVIDKFNEWSKEIIKKLEDAWFRVELDDSTNWLNKKIRNAELEKIPYIVVIGEKELENWTLSVREYKSKAQYELSVDDFISNLKEEIEKKIIK